MRRILKDRVCSEIFIKYRLRVLSPQKEVDRASRCEATDLQQLRSWCGPRTSPWECATFDCAEDAPYTFTLSQDRFRKQSCSAYPTSLRWTAVNCSYIIWKILHALSCTYIIPTFHVTLGGKWALQQHLQHAEQACRVSVVSRVIFIEPYRALTISSKPVHGSTLQIPRLSRGICSVERRWVL